MARSLRDTELRRLARGHGPIVAGPWTGSLGLELLYWIPFLRWLTTEGGVDPSRVIAVSRGGVGHWYSPIARRYVELFDHFVAPQVVRRRSRVGRQALRIARDVAGSERVEVLDPRTMWRALGRGWERRVLPSGAPTVHAPLRADDRPAGLPERYAAVKLYFNDSLPDTPANRETLQRTLERLSAQTDVVLLPETIGAHEEFAAAGSPRVHAVSLVPADNLAVQAQIVRHAAVLVSTYGGFSYLGPHVGTPTLALYSAAPRGLAQLDLIDRVGRKLGNGSPLFRARHVGALDGR